MPSETEVNVGLSSASFASSRYGNAEFAIVPDDSVSGYVWSEYWNSVYGATISNGETTVGAIHWIDLYGEAAINISISQNWFTEGVSPFLFSLTSCLSFFLLLLPRSL